MIDVDRLRRTVDLVQLLEADGVELKRAGTEFEALCPFHVERTPSFRVVPAKGFVHCFGCGVHYDAIGYVMATRKLDFVEACKQLGADDLSRTLVQRANKKWPETGGELRRQWVPVLPPDDAPRWAPDVPGDVFIPKRNFWWRGVAPGRADAYRDATGRLLGYVLRLETGAGRKITPTITWCIGPDGDGRWCMTPFWVKRPLFGLDQLAAKPDAPVLVVEGEKCAVLGAGALPQYAVISWPGGSKGVQCVDWSPLARRTLVLWPDADQAGDEAMFGVMDRSRCLRRPGVAQLAERAGCAGMRWVDVAGQPKGWDIADALADGWTPKQLAAWAATRTQPVTWMSEVAAL